MSQILIIDDDPTIRLTLSKSLQKQGYDVAVANDGEEGLREAKRLYPSLIICDWMMPVMDGLEVCRNVKATPDLSNTYFILLTSRDQVGDLVQGLENGADDFLAKPPNLSELKARVRAGLRLHQANKDLQTQKQHLEAELAQAADYVRSLLPVNLQGEVTTRSSFLPSTQLGGDCFDHFWLDPDHLVIYLLDVSGHGVGSALLSVSVLNLLRNRGLRSHSQVLPEIDFRQPDAVLGALNDAFQMSYHQDMYFTIWYGIYNRVERKLVYASGGHPPAILVLVSGEQQTKPVEYLKTTGLPIGMLSGTDFETGSCDIPPDSTLYLFSDGAYEITQSDDTVWGIDALMSTLANTPPDGLSNLDYAVMRAKEVRKYPNSFEDDLSLLEVKFD